MSTLAEVVAAADPALAAFAVEDPEPGRFAEVEGIRGFVLEAVYEGYLMHYGEPRDVEAVAVLSDLISGSAQAQAEGRPDDAEALWRASSGALASQHR